MKNKENTVSCPNCGTVENKPVSFSKKFVECQTCENLYAITQHQVDKEPTVLPRRKTLTNIDVSSSTRIHKKKNKHKSKQKDYMLKLCIGMGVGMFFLVLLIAFAGSGSSENSETVVSLKETGKTPQTQKKDKKSTFVKETTSKHNLISSGSVKSVQLASRKESLDQVNPVEIRQLPKKPVVRAKKPAKASKAKKTPVKQTAKVKTKKAVSKTAKKKEKVFILSPKEESYRDELLAVERTELSENERNALNMLNNKYQWYNSKRYHMSRATMDKEWKRRWDEIKESNKMVKSRSDSLKRRSLQILLEKCKTIKERSYMMRIYSKTTSSEESKIVKAAKDQAKRERASREKKYGEVYYKKKAEKKVYQDEYGYRYYLVDGKRVDIDGVPKKVEKGAKVKETEGPMILGPKEEAYRQYLSNLDRRDMSEQEKKALDMLNNKYAWYKVKRYHMSRSQMDEEWNKRYGEIETKNDKVIGKSDSSMSRPLQILLEGCKTVKERAYMMRVYQKPVSYKEKEMVRKARAQFLHERTMSHKKYKGDAGKKKGRDIFYHDKYGYKYYVNLKGWRVYVKDR